MLLSSTSLCYGVTRADMHVLRLCFLCCLLQQMGRCCVALAVQARHLLHFADQRSMLRCMQRRVGGNVLLAFCGKVPDGTGTGQACRFHTYARLMLPLFIKSLTNRPGSSEDQTERLESSTSVIWYVCECIAQSQRHLRRQLPAVTAVTECSDGTLTNAIAARLLVHVHITVEHICPVRGTNTGLLLEQA